MAQIRSRQWNVVINTKLLENLKIDEKLALNGLRYAYIFHNDTEKQKHIHLVLDFDNARSFESIQKIIPGAHIEKVINLPGSIQYLTHKNDSQKEQYTYEEIKTNSEDWLKELYNKNTNSYINDEDTLINDLLTGTYESMFDLILSKKYSMEWLQRRYKMIELIFLGLGVKKSKTLEAEKENRRKIKENQKKTAYEFFGDD